MHAISKREQDKYGVCVCVCVCLRLVGAGVCERNQRQIVWDASGLA